MNRCLACGPGEQFWKGYNNAKFPQIDASYNSYQTNGGTRGGGIGGINNSKNFRTYGSSFTILKKSLTTVNTTPNKTTIGQMIQGGPTGTISETSYTNVGGPGDQTASIPIRTGTARGIKARLIVQPRQTGVDVKHGSYERYLARKRGWVPPSNLEAPEPPEGYHHRWVRFEFRGMTDDKNVTSRIRSGYEPVRADEYPDRLDLPVLSDGKFKGIIAVGGLMLMRCPIEVKEDRDEYFANLTNDQQQSVDNDLMKEEHPSMPISKERQSRVTFGGNKKS